MILYKVTTLQISLYAGYRLDAIDVPFLIIRLLRLFVAAGLVEWIELISIQENFIKHDLQSYIGNLSTFSHSKKPNCFIPPTKRFIIHIHSFSRKYKRLQYFISFIISIHPYCINEQEKYPGQNCWRTQMSSFICYT